MIRHHDQGDLETTEFILVYSSINKSSIRTRKHDHKQQIWWREQKTKIEHLLHKHKTESKLEVVKSYKSRSSLASDEVPSARPRLRNLPKLHHQLKTELSSNRAYEGHFSFRSQESPKSLTPSFVVVSHKPLQVISL